MQTHRFMFVAMLACVIAGCNDGVADSSGGPRQLTSPPIRLATEGDMPTLDGATTWLNSPPLRTADLRGEVVVVQFWTYTCVNWRRTLPYVRAWAKKYRDQGLVVVGVHTPEFAFEKDARNVSLAAKEMGIDYPVAIDSRRQIWKAFDNEYWPALYFVDADGRIRHHQFGEGDYARSETVIQQLLAEAGKSDISHELVSVDTHGLEVPADWVAERSPETYVGYGQAQNFASPGGVVRGTRRTYTAPARLTLNRWALAGDWTVEEEPAELDRSDGRIVYRFHARDLNLVMSPGVPGSSVRFHVLIDGHPPGSAHGADVDEKGEGNVAEPRTYQLIRQQQPVKDRVFEIEFLSPAVKVFDFTFG